MIAIIDLGTGNLRSVAKALELVGAQVEITTSVRTLERARAVVLPGVGAFQQGMQRLRQTGMDSKLRELVAKGIPFLGICLGLQLLFTRGHEDGIHRGLDIVSGAVTRLPADVKIPHMGWNTVKKRLSTPLLQDIADNSYFYFAHSYRVEPEEPEVVAGVTDYGGDFASLISRGNLHGVQFHPEKSGRVGLKALANFVQLVPRS